jgi:chromosome partitioning protein
MQTKIISFAAKKGGVGKSTLTSIFANYLQHQTNDSFIVCDLDYDQKTLAAKRESELLEGRDTQDLYALEVIKSSDFSEVFKNAIDGNFDYVLLDIPGNLEQAGIRQALAYCDHIIIPCHYSESDVQSFVDYVKFIREEIDPMRVKFGLKEINLRAVLNRVMINSVDYKDFRAAKKDYADVIQFLDVDLPLSEPTFQRNLSTVNEYKEAYSKNTYISKFCTEVYETIKK